MKKGKMVFIMSDDKMTKIIEAITELGIDEDLATEILGIFIDTLGYNIDEYNENIKTENQNLKTENEKLSKKIKKVAAEGIMKSKKCRNVKALFALVDIDGIDVDDDGNVTGIDIEKLMEEYPYLFEKEKSRRYGKGFEKSGKTESSIEKNFKNGLLRR